MSNMARTKVFKDPQGNRMLFPSMIYYNRADEPLGTDLWSRGIQMRAATGLEMENDWLEIDTEKFPNFRIEIGSSGFAHGAATVLLFEGPKFNEMCELMDKDNG